VVGLGATTHNSIFVVGDRKDTGHQRPRLLARNLGNTQ
jgi:hypothetical protein